MLCIINDVRNEKEKGKHMHLTIVCTVTNMKQTLVPNTLYTALRGNV